VSFEDIQNELHVIEAVCKNDTQENVVKVLRTGQLKNSSLYFVDMERCDLTLREYLQGKLPVMRPGDVSNEEAGLFYKAWFSHQKGLYIVTHVSKGIQFIQSKNFVHRDINPNNSNVPRSYAN
jgi:serine/threonine protein kinase